MHVMINPMAGSDACVISSHQHGSQSKVCYIIIEKIIFI